MKTPETNDRRDATNDPLVKKRGTLEIRLVSRPNQKVLREWDITLPDELVAALTMGDI